LNHKAADNIGFDVRGEVKIFDFGLAKELNPSLQLQDGNYKLTGFTGSLRYMAPEVVNSIPYNLSADVFSFGVILWVITSCSIPYQGWTVKMYKEKVAGKGLRPTINESWRKEISNLIKSCWAQDSRKRPSFEEVMEHLQKVIVTLSSGDRVQLDLDLSRTSLRGSKNMQF